MNKIEEILIETPDHTEYLHFSEEVGSYDHALYATIDSEDANAMIRKINTEVQKQKEKAVIEYRLNFEKGVQNVVESTVAKDRVAEIREEAVREFAHWCESNKLGSCVLPDAEHYLKTKGNKE